MNTVRKPMLLVLLCCSAAGCENERSSPRPETPTLSHDEVPSEKEEAVKAVEAPDAVTHDENQLAGIHRLFKISDRIYSGSQPEGEAAFASLKKLGIQTVVSVDGTIPQTELAHAHGLRYVHIPIGYDGVPRSACDSLTRVMRELQGPVYIHCHHGRHRGPAAAAVAWVASGDATNQQAVAILEQAGTSRNYSGLWRDVENFRPAPAEATLPELVETAEVSSLVRSMVEIDLRFDRIKASRQRDWKSLPGRPAGEIGEEAVLIQEAFTETNRHLSHEFDASFAALLKESATAAGDLVAALQADAFDKADQAFQRIEKACMQCHRTYRDR
ncbi:hypothetical protein [Schlesneria sp.]|uniref:hypothetical protein n=1 Tax=Schlesneria sp. TaxID=2762018 RepID=UPI002EFFE696